MIAATVTNTTTEGLLQAVFSTQFAPRLYKKASWTSQRESAGSLQSVLASGGHTLQGGSQWPGVAAMMSYETAASESRSHWTQKLRNLDCYKSLSRDN
jgi:hypothetical protein